MTTVMLVREPLIVPVAEMRLRHEAAAKIAEWLRVRRPACLPEGREVESFYDLLPHHDDVSDNELLAEVGGRVCYHSFADAAGRKSNADYMDHIFTGDIIHASITYHPKMTFFFGGTSRSFSHQFIRNYVGSDRDEEGSPSQESTRFTHHYGSYVIPPADLNRPEVVEEFRASCQANYDDYESYLAREIRRFEEAEGRTPRGGDRKKIYEAAAKRLSMSAETSFLWTTNPAAVTKFLRERAHEHADAEIARFAKALARVVFAEYPNLFRRPDLDKVRAFVGVP